MDELQILVKAIVDDSSEQSMDSQLGSLAKKLGEAHKINLKVALEESSVKSVQSQLQAIAKQVNTSGTGKGAQIKVFDSAQLQADGQKYFSGVKDIVSRVQTEFSKMGKVDVTNVFKDAKGNIQSFTASVTKADGVVEKFNFELAKIKEGAKSFNGFVQSNSILSDKNAGTGLEQTLNYLNRIDTKIADITSRTLVNTSKPLLGDMEQYNQYQTKLSEVKARIEEIKKANTTLSADHKREIDSMVADLQRYAKELQSTAYAATDLNAATFSNKKAELQAALQTDIKKWTNAGLFGGDFEAAVNKAKTTLDNALDPTDLDAYRHQLSLISQQFKQMKLESSASGKLLDADKLNANIRIAQQRIQNLKSTYSSFVSDPKLLGQWQNLFDESNMISSQKELTNLNAKIRLFEQQLISAGKHNRSLFDELKANAVKMGTWMILGGVIAGVMRGVTGLYDAVVDLDTAMTELKKVTNETDAAYDAFLSSAADKAVEIGAAYSDFVTATSDFARLGYTINDAASLAEVATVYSVVGDEINGIDDATSSIISTMKAFNIQTEDAMLIVDKFNEVGNNFAISSGGIGEAMQRSASAMAAANNTIDESIALMVAANNVIQDPTMVGTMWKTVSMRIRGATTELEAAGLETEYMAESTASLQKKVKALTNVDGLGGFDIMLDADNFKSTYDIILGISEVWEHMSDIDQAALLELLAGKRQGNALAAAITNMKDAVEVMNTSINAEGSAMKEHEKWMDSIQAKQQQFQAQYEVFANTLMDSDIIKFVYDSGTGLLGYLTELVETTGALPALFAAITPFMDKFQLFKTTAYKDSTALGLGITTTRKANRLEWEHDIQLLDEYKNRLESLGITNAEVEKKQVVWNDTIGKGSDKLKNFVGVSDDAAAASTAYKGTVQKASAETVKMGIKAQAAAVGVQILNTALNMLIGFGVGLVIQGIISAFTGLADAAKESAESAKQNAEELKSTSDASSAARQSLKELIDEYDELRQRSEGAWSVVEANKLSQIQEEITDLVGKQAENLDLVNGKIEEEYEKLLNIYGLMSQEEYDDAESYYRATQEKLEEGYQRETNWHGASKEDDHMAYWYITKAYEQLNDVEQKVAQKWWGAQAGLEDTAWAGDIPTALEQIGSYEDGLESLYEWRRMLLDIEEEGFGYMGKEFWTGEEKWVAYDTGDAISYLNTKIQEFEEIIEEADAAKQRFFSAKANQEVLDYLLSNDIDTQDAFDEYVMSVYNNSSISKDYAEALVNTMHSFLPAFSIPDEVRRAFIAERDELISEITSEIPAADQSVLGDWLDSMSTSRYETFVNWWNQNKTSAVVTDSDTAMMEAFNAYLERTQLALEGVSSSGVSARDAVMALWESADFADTKQELTEIAQTLDGITPDTILELAEESDALASILEMDGMNAEFLANVLQSMAEGGDGLALITDDALKLNDALEGMVGKFDQVTEAKARYDAAMSVEEKDTDFRSYAEAFEELNAQFEAGTTNSNAFWAAAEFLFGSEQLAVWGWSDGLDAIYTAMQNNKVVFSDAESAGAGFIERLYEMAEASKLVNEEGEKLLEIGKDATGAYFFDIDPDNLEAIAEKMGITEEAALACLKALSMWGDIDFYDLTEVIEVIDEIGLSCETTGDKAINVERLTEQLLTLGKNEKDVHDILQALQDLDGVSLFTITGDVDTLTTSLTNLGLVTEDGVEIKVNYEGLADLMANLGYTQVEAENLIKKLDEADGIELANANEEVQTLETALEYVGDLEFTEVTENVNGVTDAVGDLDESSTDNVVSELDAVGEAADIAVTKVYDIGTAIDSVDGKECTVYYSVKQKNGILGGLAGILGFAKGTDSAPAGKALVGEEGAELVKSGNRAYLVGTNGAEIVHLNEGDQVYPADETKRILNGSGRGIRGTIPAYAEGRAVTSGLRVETDKTGTTGTPYKVQVEAEIEATLDDTELEDQLEDTLKKMEEDINEILGNFEHDIFLLEKNGGTPEQIIEIYKAMQREVHNQAEAYRKLGLDENSDYIQELQKKWWDYQDTIEDMLHDIYKTTVEEHENTISYLESQYDALDSNRSGDAMTENLNKQLEAQRAIQRAAVEEADRLRATGLEENDEAIQECIDTWWDAESAIRDINGQIADNVLGVFDDFIEYADGFELWGDLDFTKVDYLKQKIAAINKLFKDGVLTLKEYNSLLRETQLEIYNEQKEALTEIIEMTMELVRQEAEDKVEALEQQIEDYQRIIELKKKSLATSEEEEDYEKEVAKRVAEIAEIQARIAQLDRDDSREANAEKQQLAQELAQLQEELADYQADYAYNAQVDALDKEAETFEDTKNKEIAKVEATVDTEEEVYNAAIARIDSNWEQLYQDLIEWNRQYGDMIDGEDSITSAWQTAKAAAEEYGSVVSALNGISSSIAYEEEQIRNQQYTEEAIHQIIKEMYANSQAHHSADTAGKARLNKRNLELGAMLAQYGITAVRGNDGVWYVDRVGGEQLYDKYRQYTYHTGGIVGEDPALKPNEVLAKLEIGEAVLTKEEFSGLFDKMKAGIIGVVDALVGGLTASEPVVSEVMKSVTNNNGDTDNSVNEEGIEIHNEFHMQNVTEENMKQFADYYSDYTIDKLLTTSKRKGMKNTVGNRIL